MRQFKGLRTSDEGTSYCFSCETYARELDKLRAERDRYREGLVHIVRDYSPGGGETFIAIQALAFDKEKEGKNG